MRRHYKINWLGMLCLWILVLGCMFIIFNFSSQVASNSNALSTKVTEKLINIFPYYHHLSSIKQADLIKHYNNDIRKLAHFTIYMILGIFLFGLFSFYNTYLKNRIVNSLFVGLLYAISDEVHQIFVHGRGPQIRDVCIDFLGIVVGVIMCTIVVFIIRRCKKVSRVHLRR